MATIPRWRQHAILSTLLLGLAIAGAIQTEHIAAAGCKLSQVTFKSDKGESKLDFGLSDIVGFKKSLLKRGGDDDDDKKPSGPSTITIKKEREGGKFLPPLTSNLVIKKDIPDRSPILASLRQGGGFKVNIKKDKD